MAGLTFAPILRTCQPSFDDGRHLFLMHAQTKYGHSWGLSTYARNATEAQQQVQMHLVGESKIVATCRVLRWKK